MAVLQFEMVSQKPRFPSNEKPRSYEECVEELARDYGGRKLRTFLLKINVKIK